LVLGRDRLKHFLQGFECARQACGMHGTHPLNEPLFVECANLIEQDQALFALKTERDSEGRWTNEWAWESACRANCPFCELKLA
jgi:hypothetical protein